MEEKDEIDKLPHVSGWSSTLDGECCKYGCVHPYTPMSHECDFLQCQINLSVHVLEFLVTCDIVIVVIIRVIYAQSTYNNNFNWLLLSK